MTDDDSHAALLARVSQGDEQAACELVRMKLPRLLALAQRMLGNRAEAEEVAQEVFLRVWKQAPQWAAGLASLDTWLHRVALNLCYDRLRKRKDEEHVDAHPYLVDNAATPDEHLDAAQRGALLKKALAGLPTRQREALVLQYYQELPNADAAGLMNISVDALESLLARARRTLRARLAGDGKEEK